MFTTKLFDRDVTVLEHMKEIKSTSNGHLFNRFYNKKQMFSFFLGKGCGDSDFGKCCGFKIHEAPDWYVEFYKLEDVDFDKVLSYIDENKYWPTVATAEKLRASKFFVKDDAGQIYFVVTNSD